MQEEADAALAAALAADLEAKAAAAEASDAALATKLQSEEAARVAAVIDKVAGAWFVALYAKWGRRQQQHVISHPNLHACRRTPDILARNPDDGITVTTKLPMLDQRTHRVKYTEATRVRGIVSACTPPRTYNTAPNNPPIHCRRSAWLPSPT